MDAARLELSEVWLSSPEQKDIMSQLFRRIVLAEGLYFMPVALDIMPDAFSPGWWGVIVSCVLIVCAAIPEPKKEEVDAKERSSAHSKR